MTTRHRIRFFQQMAILSRAGVPLRSSFERLKGRFSGNDVALLSERIDAGDRLGEAFAAAGFSTFECNLIAAGEKSGQLEKIFQHLSEFWVQQREMSDAIIRPLYYPIMVLHLAMFLGAAVDLATSVPWPVALFHMAQRLGVAYAIGIGLFLFVRFTWSSSIAQRFWIMLPIIGRTLSAAHAYRWITALRIEFRAGITLSVAVADAWRSSGYVGSERKAVESQEALRKGTPLSQLIQRWRQLPRDWIDFIETGEVSGGLEDALADLEQEAARAWRMAQQRMSEWVPRILYFAVLVVTAAQVGMLMYHVIIAPITNVEHEIDQATSGN